MYQQRIPLVYKRRAATLDTVQRIPREYLWHLGVSSHKLFAARFFYPLKNSTRERRVPTAPKHGKATFAIQRNFNLLPLHLFSRESMLVAVFVNGGGGVQSNICDGALETTMHIAHLNALGKKRLK